MCKQQVQLQPSPSQQSFFSCFSSDSLQSLTIESSDFLQHEKEEVSPSSALFKPPTKADALNEVEKMNNANMRAIPFTCAKLRYSVE